MNVIFIFGYLEELFICEKSLASEKCQKIVTVALTVAKIFIIYYKILI